MGACIAQSVSTDATYFTWDRSAQACKCYNGGNRVREGGGDGWVQSFGYSPTGLKRVELSGNWATAVWPVLYCTEQYSVVQYSTVMYTTVRYTTVQYSTYQYSTVQRQYILVQFSMKYTSY